MIGLVLEGGGSRGAYHAGAYKAILEEGIKIDGVTGTSVGALNGAMIAQGDFDTCYELWQNIKYDRVIDVNMDDIEDIENMEWNINNLLSIGGKIKNLLMNKGFDITPFKELLDSQIDEKKLRDSNIDFGLVTVNVTDMKPVEIFKEDIPQGKIKDYLLASAYLPGFKPEKLGGKRYLDGAFYDNLPFSMLLEKGYDELILVRTHATGLTKKIDKDIVDVIEIRPSQDLGKTYTYESELARENLKLGYYDTLRALRKYKGSIYTIEDNKSDDYYFNLLSNMDNKVLNEIVGLFNIKDIPSRRALFEVVIPKIAGELDLKKGYSYGDVVIGILERKAKDLGIDEFNIYTFEQLVSIVKSEDSFKEEYEIGRIEKIIEKTELSPIFNLERLVLKVADILFIDDKPLLLE